MLHSRGMHMYTKLAHMYICTMFCSTFKPFKGNYRLSASVRSQVLLYVYIIWYQLRSSIQLCMYVELLYMCICSIIILWYSLL